MALKVLIVDDNSITRLAISHCLKRGGYEVVAVADGIEAVSKASGDAFDLVLSDFAMPGMDGLALTHAIHTLAPKTPVIFMSGHPEVRRENVLGAGAADFLEKPLILDDLLAKIELALLDER